MSRLFVAAAHRDRGNRCVVRADEKLSAFVELEWRLRSLRTSYLKRLIALIPIRIAVVAVFASSDVVAGVVF
jgi:hypothetical protein